jgi:hypothetical protein
LSAALRLKKVLREFLKQVLLARIKCKLFNETCKQTGAAWVPLISFEL